MPLVYSIMGDLVGSTGRTEASGMIGISIGIGQGLGQASRSWGTCTFFCLSMLNVLRLLWAPPRRVLSFSLLPTVDVRRNTF